LEELAKDRDYGVRNSVINKLMVYRLKKTASLGRVLAVIRDTDATPCPFGLKIPFACRNVGDSIYRMAPTDALGEDADDEEKSEIAKANNTLMMMEAVGERCSFAGKVFKDKKAVECNFGSTAQGVNPDRGLTPSPFYSKVYDNIAYDGVYSYPLGWFGENNISRNTYYGIYSLQGSVMSNKKIASYHRDILDAIQHVVFSGDENVTKTLNYKVDPKHQLPVKEIVKWDDYSSWGEINWGELYSLNKKELVEELNKYRPGFGNMAINWLNPDMEPIANSDPSHIPPVVLVESLDGSRCVGDGRGRVNMAVGLGLSYLPVVILKEVLDGGDIQIDVENGRVMSGFTRSERPKTAGVIDLSDKFKQKQEDQQQKNILQQLNQSAPDVQEPVQLSELEKAREKKLLSDVYTSEEYGGVWMHRFSDVRKDDSGFFILKSDNPAGQQMSSGQLLADFSLNMTPYWKITKIQGDRINLEPIGPNPFLTGVGAGGAKLTDSDIRVFTGEYEKERIAKIQKMLQEGTATLDNVIYLLDGMVPTQIGPNGSQGSQYDASDRANRGGRKGMSAKDIMISDAQKLRNWGFVVPQKALSGDLDPYQWDKWLSGNGNGIYDAKYVPKDVDKYLDYYRKMTEKGRWHYDEKDLAQKKEQLSQKKPSGELWTEGEDESEESIIRNVFNKERRVSVRNTKLLIEMARENPQYIIYLYDMMRIGKANWQANEKVLQFFEESDDVEGLKLGAKHLNDTDNRRYAISYLAKFDPNAALQAVRENEPLSSFRGLFGSIISVANDGDATNRESVLDSIIETCKRHNLIQRIGDAFREKDYQVQYEADEVLGSLRNALGLVGIRWMSENDVKDRFPQYWDFFKDIRELSAQTNNR
jgi:hypothetical protein